MAERVWVMPLVYLAVGLCAVGSGVWLHGSYFAVEPPHAEALVEAAVETPVETPAEPPPTLSREVSFIGRALELYYTDIELPVGVYVGFDDAKPADRGLGSRVEYLLRIQDGKVVEAFELAGAYYYLKDLTGDGREEFVVDGYLGFSLPAQGGERVRRVGVHEKMESDSRPEDHVVVYGGGPTPSFYEVYALGEPIRRIGRTEHEHSSVGASSYTVTDYKAMWGDPYGTGLPVYCRTEVERRSKEVITHAMEGREKLVVTKHLVGTWEFDKSSGTFAWVDRHVLIPGQGKGLTSGDLQGLLRR